VTSASRLIGSAILGDERAEYGSEIVATLSQQLTARYGRGFGIPNLSRMVTFARVFPDEQIVATLWRQLSWSHFRELLPLKSGEAREYYARMAVTEHLSVRELAGAIARKAFERQEIADSQITPGSSVPMCHGIERSSHGFAAQRPSEVFRPSSRGVGRNGPPRWWTIGRGRAQRRHQAAQPHPAQPNEE
jgi:hypothetical protein